MRIMIDANVLYSALYKPNSIVARMPQLVDTVVEALNGKQIQPVLIEKFLDNK